MSKEMQKGTSAIEPSALRPGHRYRFGTTSVIALVVLGTVIVAGLKTHVLEVLKPDVEETDIAALPSAPDEFDPEDSEVPFEVGAQPLSFEFMTAPAPSIDERPEDTEASPEVAASNSEERTEDTPSADIGQGLEGTTDTKDPVAHVGDEVEGLELARLTVLNAGDASVVSGWLLADMAVLEIHTDRGLFLGIGSPEMATDGFRSLHFARLSNLDEDHRSDLRMSSLDPAALPMGIIRAQLGAHSGIYDIERVELVFTEDAASRITQGQANVLARLHRQGISAAANELDLAICIDRSKVQVSAVSRLSDGALLGAPSECGYSEP